jgi:hypothetical protein
MSHHKFETERNQAYTEKEEDTMLYKFACNDSQNLWLRKTNLQRIIFEAPENATEHELDLKYSHAGMISDLDLCELFVLMIVMQDVLLRHLQ